MKMALVSMLLIFSNVACTTLEPVDVPAGELQQQLRSGALVTAGDRVRLVTADEAVHTFRVTEISLDQDMVRGRDVEVPIKEVVAVETREVSVGRTTLLTGGVGLGVAVLIAIAIAPAIILGGG
ncbi:MAG TPA: hypothetical protein VLA11_00825 [Woeseiaceae bacterium]|jgi:hypothetical protein|nr:hypothetical protein [Woeseiaceae bacterium]